MQAAERAAGETSVEILQDVDIQVIMFAASDIASKRKRQHAVNMQQVDMPLLLQPSAACIYCLHCVTGVIMLLTIAGPPGKRLQDGWPQSHSGAAQAQQQVVHAAISEPVCGRRCARQPLSQHGGPPVRGTAACKQPCDGGHIMYEVSACQTYHHHI